MGLLADAKSMLKKDPAARSLVEVMLLYPGFHALVFYRVSHWFYKHGRLPPARRAIFPRHVSSFIPKLRPGRAADGL